MAMKKAFTLIEVIVTIAILGILSAGTFVALKHLYLRSAKSKAISELSFSTQIVVDQIAALLYQRVPASTIGSNSTGAFRPIDQIYDANYTILEWIGVDVEAYTKGAYSGFIDMDASDKDRGAGGTAVSFDVNATDINNTFLNKFGQPRVNNDIALVFSGSFDDSSLSASNDFNTSFGWYRPDHNLTYTFTIANNDSNITFTPTKPREIYERYYLVDSAYAVARKDDIIPLLPCANARANDENGTLYLFYNFRPWKREDLCDGNSTILSENVKGFQAGVINNNIYFNISLEKEIRGSENNVTISKEKVVF
jgi:prepilin-type N-terminal cleavage/methylation domain-containing protein